jgi:surface antigen
MPTVQLQAQNPPESVQSPPESNCREFTAPVTVGGQQQQAVGQACEQPDGSWQITQNTPGSPPQVYTLPPQAVYDYPYPYPYYSADPWDFGPPFFAGGSIFFADGFHHFHDHDGFRHEPFHGGGFHGGGGHR